MRFAGCYAIDSSRAFQSHYLCSSTPLTFEEEVQLSRDNIEKYTRTVALDKVPKLLIFATEQGRDKVEAMIKKRVDSLQ